MFATKFTSDCECDDMVHSASDLLLQSVLAIDGPELTATVGPHVFIAFSELFSEMQIVASL